MNEKDIEQKSDVKDKDMTFNDDVQFQVEQMKHDELYPIYFLLFVIALVLILLIIFYICYKACPKIKERLAKKKQGITETKETETASPGKKAV